MIPELRNSTQQWYRGILGRRPQQQVTSKRETHKVLLQVEPPKIQDTDLDWIKAQMESNILSQDIIERKSAREIFLKKCAGFLQGSPSNFVSLTSRLPNLAQELLAALKTEGLYDPMAPRLA